MNDQRPDPNALLQRVLEEEQKERRGKLKIFLGAAPGVGKTHSMLHEALEEQMKGLDIIIGIVESHGRSDIEEKLKNFVLLPKIILDYHGKKLQEFDLDAALKRNPGLILMDEMAHTNVSGVRHKKRWQDIKELLDRGIDVYTTLNVQHIESLNDDVSQIIHAPINETVPDIMIEIANTIELVDLAPEHLLKRLAEGKVYLPKQAQMASEFYFRKGNLMALRELALRTLAKQVNTQVLLYRKGQGIKHIWPIMEKILVCVGPGPESHKLIRAAKRMASSLQVDWIAIYVDSPRTQVSQAQRNQAIKNLFFAEQLGAETHILIGYDLVKEIINYSHEQNVTLIMLWKQIRTRWRNFFSRSLADEILRYSGEIDVYTMTGETNKKSGKKILAKPMTPWLYYFLSTSIVAITSFINCLLYPLVNESNLILIYLIGMTSIALLGRTGPTISGIFLSIIAYDYFFIPPYYSFLIENPDYIFTLVVLFIMALIICQMTLVTRRQIEIVRIAEYQTSALYTLSRRLSRTRGIIRLLRTGINYISEIFHCEILALLPKKGVLIVRAKSKSRQELDEKEQSIAQWVFELGQKAGLGTDTLSFSNALYIPLLGTRGTIGVLRVQPVKNNDWATPEKIQLLESCANQIALALEADSLPEEQNKTP
ncbi:MAG: sensor histidine kinase KdpD [Legionella longbeachae]|nr:sensor histidine kinase KdpD [Legionella longbeachae]